MCFKSVSYCTIHTNVQMVVITCKACNGDGCQFCNRKGVEKYCPTCREENVSRFKLFRPRI